MQTDNVFYPIDKYPIDDFPLDPREYIKPYESAIKDIFENLKAYLFFIGPTTYKMIDTRINDFNNKNVFL